MELYMSKEWLKKQRMKANVEGYDFEKYMKLTYKEKDFVDNAIDKQLAIDICEEKYGGNL